MRDRVAMEWLMASAFWSVLAYVPPGGAYPPSVVAGPTEIDTELVRLCYEFIAGEFGCATCAAPLGRDQRVVVTAGWGPWQILAVTRCHGRRRHRHTATAGEVGGDLWLGPFRGRGRIQARRLPTR
jgi:hypothetical protein